ncbi:MAG: hypothetical protein Q4E32_07330 [Bacteroidales bacterium]|nr:hypothetical protein [Bacteroidales bacterium]
MKKLILILMILNITTLQAQRWDEHIGRTTMGTFGDVYGDMGGKVRQGMGIEAEGYPNFQVGLGVSRAYGEFARLKWCIGGVTGFSLYGGIGKDLFLDMKNSDVTAWHAGLGYYVSDCGAYDVMLGMNYAETPVIHGGSLNFDLEYTYFFNRGRFCRCRRYYGHDRYPFGVFFGAGLGIGNLKAEKGKEKPIFVWDIHVGVTIALTRHHTQEYYDCKRSYSERYNRYNY